jgi:hypothetical protein
LEVCPASGADHRLGHGLQLGDAISAAVSLLDSAHRVMGNVQAMACEVALGQTVFLSAVALAATVMFWL